MIIRMPDGPSRGDRRRRDAEDLVRELTPSAGDVQL
jgi:hypothetical protein